MSKLIYLINDSVLLKILIVITAPIWGIPVLISSLGGIIYFAISDEFERETRRRKKKEGR